MVTGWQWGKGFSASPNEWWAWTLEQCPNWMTSNVIHYCLHHFSSFSKEGREKWNKRGSVEEILFSIPPPWSLGSLLRFPPAPLPSENSGTRRRRNDHWQIEKECWQFDTPPRKGKQHLACSKGILGVRVVGWKRESLPHFLFYSSTGRFGAIPRSICSKWSSWNIKLVFFEPVWRNWYHVGSCCPNQPAWCLEICILPRSDLHKPGELKAPCPLTPC